MRNETPPAGAGIGECSSSSSSAAASLSSSQQQQQDNVDVDDDKMIAIALSEEYAKLDAIKVAQCLPNLAPVPHIPRINSYIPDLSDANLDHQRLLQRLTVYGLYEVKVSGDGNCQFRALSDQIYRSPEYHKYVRKEVVKQLKDYHALYEGYVPMKYKHYCKKMAKSGEWGDHVTLQAAADKFAAKICLLTSFRDTCFIEILPQYQPPARELWLSFWSEVHYNSLYELRVQQCYNMESENKATSVSGFSGQLRLGVGAGVPELNGSLLGEIADFGASFGGCPRTRINTRELKSRILNKILGFETILKC